MPTSPQILSEEALQEIEREPWMHSYGDDRLEAPLESRRIAITVGQRNALCATVRALNKTVSELREEVKRLIDERSV